VDVPDQLPPPSHPRRRTPEGRPDRRPKIGSPLSAGPEAYELAGALMGLDQKRALGLLTTATADGWDVKDVEDFIIEPAVTRLGDLWTHGRLDEGTFRRAGALAEAVELAWRNHLVRANAPPSLKISPKRPRG
jgi:hypothetical protein